MNLELALRAICTQPKLHALWLNSLSYMENVGASKILHTQNPETLTVSILKHAAEETRHAYMLKFLISKVAPSLCHHYRNQELLAPWKTKHYISKLEAKLCRLLKSEFKLKKNHIHTPAYLLTTYAIERRAERLYPLYESLLSELKLPFTVQNIVSEEKAHLAQMAEEMKKVFGARWRWVEEKALEIEGPVYFEWEKAIISEVLSKTQSMNANAFI